MLGGQTQQVSPSLMRLVPFVCENLTRMEMILGSSAFNITLLKGRQDDVLMTVIKHLPDLFTGCVCFYFHFLPDSIQEWA